MSKLNNARIQTLGAYIAIYDIECVDTKQQIYRGKRVVEPEQRDQVWPWYYFHRNYLPEINDFDKIYKEVKLPKEMFDVEVVLIPKEKLLFGFMPHSLIQLPPPKTSKRFRQ